MDYSGTFARHFSRLVYLLMHDSENRGEQKMALRAVAAISKSGPATFAVRGEELVVNGEVVPAPLTGVSDVVLRMTEHGLLEIEFDASSSPADLLGVARLIAGEPAAGDAGAQARRQVEALAPQTIRFVTPAPPEAEPSVDPPPATDPTPSVDLASIVELVPRPERLPVEPAPRPEPAPPPGADLAPALSPPRGSGPEPAAARPSGRITPTVSGLVPEGSGGMFMQFAPSPIRDSPETLGSRLAATTDPIEVMRLLDDLVTVAENSAREGKPAVVGEIFHGIVERERGLIDPEAKRAYVMAIRRMSKPTLMRAVAMQLTKSPERRNEYVAVLVRTGEDGADAVIDQLIQAQTGDARRVYFDALKGLKAAVPALVHMLGDARWFVTRNAADLLGELQAVDAEGPLAALLRHSDERVRRSATNALMRLGTESGLRIVYEAIRDPAPQVRMQAAAAVASRRDAQTAATLIRAIDEEQDTDVQLAMIAALGKVGTKDAIERLIRAAEPERGLFKKRSAAARVAAIQALAETKAPVALAALRSLAGDRDKEIRDAVARVSQPPGRG